MQQTRMMRQMDHYRLIDETHLPLKNFAAVDSNKETVSDFQSAFENLKRANLYKNRIGPTESEGG